MIAHTAQAVGAPCPTLVLDADLLPAEEAALRPVLTRIREWLQATGSGGVLKFALIAVSAHPLFDLDFRFVQCLPGGADRFDFAANCGHSILAAVVVAEQQGLLPRLAPGGRVRVRVLNNGDLVVCELAEARSLSRDFTVHFVQSPSVPLADLLPTGRAVDLLAIERAEAGIGAAQEVSLVSLGNSYAFLDASSLGILTEHQLFGAGDGLFAQLADVRAAAARRLGRPADGALPKIAVVGAFRPGRLHVRAVAVPSWHPTLAVTGAICLAAAMAIPGTVPQRAAARVAATGPRVAVETPGGRTTVTGAIRRSPGGDLLEWVSVGHKMAHPTGSADLGRVRGAPLVPGLDPGAPDALATGAGTPAVLPRA
ncbi:PrpF domain-containing protein [Kitasatospora sp. GP82]|uniref:PrpF domain-containing protein n=1 Tax=Kitasatospora sp. GP82 TaxID=3035089 RepID=UPI0024762B05|nr:PrpF domain-containing protein [Kitasatospora sp. GP82]MDH6125711.1 2-methylaconitate cis-trans-isomerase PrpF [Kitasatospora sp. GP82]